MLNNTGETFLLMSADDVSQYKALTNSAYAVIQQYFAVIQRGSRTPETLRRMQELLAMHRDQLDRIEVQILRLLELI